MRCLRGCLCSIAVSVVAVRAIGQQPSQPLLLPPPFNASTQTSESLPSPASNVDETSEPWHPPEAALPSTSTAAPPAVAASTSPNSSSPTPEPAANPVDESLPVPSDATTSNVTGEAKASSDIVLEQPRKWYERAFMLVPVPWDTGIELGINGSAGTSDSFSMRTGGYMKRQSRFSRLNLSTYYNRTTSGSVTTQNNAQFDIRNDWLLDDKSPWTLFGQSSVFYDQFKDFDWQTNFDTGVGYRIFYENDLELTARMGGGVSREFGSVDNQWVPESLFGFDYSQQLSQTQKFYSKLDYFPQWDGAGDFRLVADTGWEVVLVQPSNLSLKISATDRFDSSPNGTQPNLVNYSIMLLLKL